MGKENFDALVSKDAIRDLLEKVSGSAENFKPTKRFYEAVKINHRRWAKLFRGELSITVDELRNVYQYLKVEFNAETFNRQLKIFDDEKR